jgi:hypothetical protein
LNNHNISSHLDIRSGKNRISSEMSGSPVSSIGYDAPFDAQPEDESLYHVDVDEPILEQRLVIGIDYGTTYTGKVKRFTIGQSFLQLQASHMQHLEEN